MTQKFYAGVGSRKTPEHIQRIMHHCAAFLYIKGWWLRSGAADKADQAFEAGHDHVSAQFKNMPRKEIYLPWAGYNHHSSQLHPENHPFSEREQYLAASLHPNWDKCTPMARNLLTRNTRIMNGLNGRKPVKLVLCWTEGGRIIGGTGQVLREAEAMGADIVNFGKAKTPEELQNMVLQVDMLGRKAA